MMLVRESVLNHQFPFLNKKFWLRNSVWGREGAGDVIGCWLNSDRTCLVYVPRHEQTAGSDRTLPLGSDRMRLYSYSLISNIRRGQPNTLVSSVSTDWTRLVMFFTF
jgi:hypothetical protein